MYAVIKTGGKQYRVTQGDVILVEKLAGEPGQAVEFDQVLMMDAGDGPAIGAPLVDGARVAATVLDQTRGEKILVFKKRRRKTYRRLRGHRQDLTALRITDILAKGQGRMTAAVEAPEPAPPAEFEVPVEPEVSVEEAAPAEAETPEAEAPEAEAPAAEAAAKKAPAKKPAKKVAKKAPAKKAAKKAPAKKKAAKKKPR